MREGGRRRAGQCEQIKCFKEKGSTVFVLLRLCKMRKEKESWGNMCVVDHNQSNFSGMAKTEAKFKYVERRVGVGWK